MIDINTLFRIIKNGCKRVKTRLRKTPGVLEAQEERKGEMQTALKSQHSVLKLRFVRDPVSHGFGMVGRRKMIPGRVKNE